MSRRIMCLLIPDFPLAARIRSEPALSEKPVAVLKTEGAASSIIAVSADARRRGIRTGHSLSQARALFPEVIAKPRDRASEQSAQEVLLEVALGLSPIIENAESGCVYLDLRGVRDERALLEEAVSASAAMGLPARAAVAAGRVTARIAARRAEEVPTIIPEGGDAAFLAPLSLATLSPPSPLLDRLTRWGVRSAGALAALPAGEIVRRLGSEGLALHRMARGEDEKPLSAWRPPPILSERVDLEWSIGELEPFLAVARPMIERLSRRLSASGLACRRVDLALALDPEGEEGRALMLAAPTTEIKTLVERISLELSSRPPKAPIVGIALRAHPDQARQIQFSLFGPSTPSPDRLATVMARLSVLLGADRIGAPGLCDGVRPERYHLTAYAPPPPPKVTPILSPLPLAVAIRVLRPMIPLVVEIGGAPPQPRFIKAECREGTLSSIAGSVRMAAGPWRMEEGWWSEEAVARAYWDVELADGELFRIYRDLNGDWFADGIYD